MEQLAKALAAAQSHAARYDDTTSETKWERDSINAIVADLEDGIAALAEGGNPPQTPSLGAFKLPFPRDHIAQEYVAFMLANRSPAQPQDSQIVNEFQASINDGVIRGIMVAAYEAADMQAEAAGEACPCPNCPNQP